MITYSSLLDELRAKGEDLKFGDDLQDAHLRTAGKIHPGFYFLTDWPLKLKPFYIREKDGDDGLSRSFDLQFGHLELSSGGTRLHDPAVLKERLMEQDLNPENFKDHLAFDLEQQYLIGKFSSFDIAGKFEQEDIANPSSFILSVKMMLEWLSTKHTDDTCSKAATKLENAVYGAVRDGAKTVDVGGSMSTSEFTDEVLRRII